MGANSGLGIPVGDRCTVEAGLYVTAGTKVVIVHADGSESATIKAHALSNKDDLLFRRNSMSGRVECLTNNNAIQLNKSLHTSN